MKTPILGVFLILFPGQVGFAPAGEIEFNRDIRPILSENCFPCHGPDAEARKARLRLDLGEEAYRDRDGSHALVPGDPEKSLLIQKITAGDPDDLMPPPDSKRRLTSVQKTLLRKWVEEGARYQKHWALIGPRRSPPPPVRRPEWTRNGIDHFVFRRLEKEGLSPAGEADRNTLVRRVSEDLTGLPPTPAEVKSFVADDSPEAYEKLVERLLASPRFGERWARPWLDLARYADSNGFQADQLRDSWAYRDWLIDALNAEMPFDRFTIEQLAGDLLPGATAAQKIATGFHRTVTCNVEAGVHPEENRTQQVIDRVTTTGTVWLGATIECAQCHDHKFDPYTMKDFYSLFAYFNNTPVEVRNPSGKGVSFDFYGPSMELGLSREEKSRRERLEKQIAVLAKKLKTVARQAAGERLAWEEDIRSSLQDPPRWLPLEIASFETNGGEDHRTLEDNSVLVTGRLPGSAIYTATVHTTLSNINGFKVETLTHPDLPGMGPGRGDAERTNFILSEFEVSVLEAGRGDGDGNGNGERKARAQPVELHSARADFSQTNWNVANAVDGNRKTGWAIAQQFHKPHWATFLTTRPLGSAEGTTLTFTLDQNYGRGRTIGRLRLSALVGDAGAASLPEDVAAVLRKERKKRSGKEKKRLDQYYAEANPAMRKINIDMAGLRKQLNNIKVPTTLVMVEMEKPRVTHVLRRGNYLDPQEEVSPRTPRALHALDPDLPPNRLGLARWLVDPENPLVARVTVNRWWAELFGHGIVATLEDFGTQSAPPTHPALLDWLAMEFVGSGWSMKHVLRVMVTSATYRQSSRLTPDLLKRDPGNRFYARGPRFRMSAEMIRDNAVAASGLLSSKMHGPPVMPHQPSGIWRQVGRNEPKWVDARNEDRFRRGVYVVWRRAAPYPSFVSFDGPDRSSCVVSRPRTNTPLQALTLMNDPAYVEMALALASRILVERPEGDLAERLDYAFHLVLSRPPVAAELAHLEELFGERTRYLRARPKVAREVVSGASSIFKPPGKLDRVELAAWFYVANVLMNLDETITKG